RLVAESFAGQHLQDHLLLGAGQRVYRTGPGPGRAVERAAFGAVMTGPRAAQQCACGLDRGDAGECVDGRVDHRGDRFVMPVLSESVSKSACAFPTRSRAALVWASSASAFSARARSCAISRVWARARRSPPA